MLTNMNNENVYRKIQEFFGSLQENFSVLEEPVDVDVQIKYFEASGKVRGTINAGDVLEKKEQLFDTSVAVEDKRNILVEMAGVPDTEVYRILEAYAKNPDEELVSWSKMALQENRLLLESHLLERRQVFVSTGLGGKGHKLRYFVVLINNEQKELEPFQQKIVREEMEYSLHKYDSELEKLDFKEEFTTLRVVIPINSDLTKLFREGIDECNQFGNFLSSDFIVTNMKELSDKEIKEAISDNSTPDVVDDDFPPVD